MKKSFLPLIAFSLIIFGLNTFTFAQSNFLITPDSVGKLKIGMTVAEARRAYPRHTFARTSDGEGIALIEVKRRGRTHFHLYANEFDPESPINNEAKIVFIEVSNPAYRTADGIYPSMRLRDVTRKYGALKSIVLSEIESREYARFERQPLGIDLKVTGRNAQAGIYANNEMRSTRYTSNAYVATIILLGRDSGTGIGDGDGSVDEPIDEVEFTSKFTNLGTQCKTPKGQGDNGGHISTYCEGYNGYRIHIFDTARSMEIAVESTDKRESVTIASQSLGFDINNRQVEWRFRDGIPFAIIMRVDEYRMGSDGTIRYPIRKTGEYLYIKGLPGYKFDRKINTRTTRNANEEAKRLADAGYRKPVEAVKQYIDVDIAPINRTIANAVRRNRAWVKSPSQVAVRLAGEISDTALRTMEFKYPSAEQTDSITLTITNEGLLDDSVRAERFIYELKKNSRGNWTVTSGQKAWSCQQNRGHQDFSAAPCS